MDVKQIRLENLVVSYFNQRDDTSIRSIPGGRYKVKLMSDIARTDIGRGLSDELILVFNTEDAYNYKDAELITSNHPLLDIIRNDLEKHEDQDPRVSEAYLPLQLVNANGTISIPKLNLLNLNEHEIGLNISFDPYYIFTYRIDYEMDGGFENIVKITISGKSGEEVQDLLPGTYDDLLISGRPEITKSAKSELPLRQIQAQSKDIIYQRVLGDLKALGQSITEQLETETKRISEYYANEISKIEKDDIDRLRTTELEKARDRELTEWEEKLAYKIKIQPLSILRLWFPLVDYELSIQSSRERYILDQITYSVHLDETSFHECKKCGNVTKFNLCLVGKHAVCAQDCAETVDTCKVCHDDFCKKHGQGCTSCNEPICTKDVRKCAYGTHTIDERFCPECITESFERKALCVICGETCDLCGRNFPHELMAVCRIGSEHICSSHEKKPDGFKCSECGEYTCSNHGSFTEEQEWACFDHQLVSSCCGKTFRKSLLEACCCNAEELICKHHSVKCFDCGKPVCENHRFALKDHRGKFVCGNCRKACSECPPDKNYVSNDLRQCNECRKKICKAHQNICVVGEEVLCSKHVITSATDEVLCESHSGYCVQTGIGKGNPIYRIDELLTCVVCDQSVCSSHRSTCKTCKTTTVCTVHIENQPKCSGCGNWACGHNGCSNNSYKCKDCGMAYCKNCITGRGICKACEGLEVLRSPAQWINHLRTLPQSIGGENTRILGEMLSATNKLKLWAASNKSYSVVVVRYSPGLLERIWKNSEQFRIVFTKSDGKLVKIKREKVA